MTVVLHCIQLIADVKEIAGKDVLSKLTKFFSRERVINILAAVKLNDQLKPIMDAVGDLTNMDEDSQYIV